MEQQRSRAFTEGPEQDTGRNGLKTIGKLGSMAEGKSSMIQEGKKINTNSAVREKTFCEMPKNRGKCTYLLINIK